MRSILGASGLVVVVLGLASPRAALGLQATPPPPPTPWRPTARVQADVRYDDNPFLLTATQKPKVENVSAADALSGRYRDMASPSDVIPAAGIEVGFAGPALGGRPLQVSLEGSYEANTSNARRRHAELRFDAEQALPHSGRLRLRADLRPSFFWKNYLSDAVDGNADNTITADERRYEPGTSNEVDLTLNYRHRLLKSRSAKPLELTGELELGYFGRTYDAPFAGRNRRGPGAAVSLTAQPGTRWTFAVGYALQALSADTSREVSILDEPDFAHDFNGNGSITDMSARAFEVVDRSRVEHDLGLSAQVELNATVTLELSYGWRRRSFSSTQPYDVADRGRRDTRHEVGGGLDVRLGHGLRLALRGVAATQNTNRAGDPGSTGEVADYSRRVVSAGLAYRP